MLDGGEITFDPLPKRLIAFQWLLAGAFAFDIVPHELIRVEFRGVSRQEMQSQASLQLFDVGCDHLRPMSWVPVHDQKDGALSASHEGREKLLLESRRIEPSRVHLIPKGSACIDGGDCFDGLPLSARGDFRRLTFLSPGPAQHLIRPHARLVQEEDVRRSSFGTDFKVRILVARPDFNSTRIAFVGATEADERWHRDLFNQVVRAAKLPHFSPMDLRHTFATILFSHNAPFLYVSKQLGHSKPKTTLQF